MAPALRASPQVTLLLSLVPALSFPLHRAATAVLFADPPIQDLRTLVHVDIPPAGLSGGSSLVSSIFSMYARDTPCPTTPKLHFSGP